MNLSQWSWIVCKRDFHWCRWSRYPIKISGSANALPEFLKPGKTAIILGSSGVGKSTLVNFLIGKDQAKIQDIREHDDRGKHTTTSRNLYFTSVDSGGGGMLIDTPGMRELQLLDHSDGISTQFSDIENLFSGCRFQDCRHDTEPGCSVKQALSEGILTADRWASYQKLEAEVRFAARKQNKALASEDRKSWKRLTQQARAHGKRKREGW